MMEILLFLIGLVLGVWINYGIYHFSYYSLPKSPWQRRPAELPVPSPLARIPIFGWGFRSKEKEKLGRWFWIRPMVIEALTPFLLVWLYRYIMSGGMMPEGAPIAMIQNDLSIQFYQVAFVFSLMTIATFIDFDERMIPDLITVPATCLALLGAATLRGWHLWEMQIPVFPNPAELGAMHAFSPMGWPISLNQNVASHQGLWLGLCIWIAWCLSLGNLRWITRRGYAKAFEYFWVSFVRSYNLVTILILLVVGSLSLIVAYNVIQPTRWQTLLSSLMGMGLGGMLVWGFRIVAGMVLRQEALGFGDVTLMAMIGAFFGWQVVWVAFFVGPVIAVVFVVTIWIITRDSSTPFGPYLCIATAYVLLDWVHIWEMMGGLFEICPPQSAIFFLIAMLGGLGALLWAVHILKLKLEELIFQSKGAKKRR